MRTRLIIGALAFATALILAPSADAADRKAEKFVTEAMQGNRAEMEMGKLAQQNGQSDGVKQYGKMLETDHGDAANKLRAVASQIGVQPPAEPNKKQQKDHHKMMDLKGDKFDRAFIKYMVKDHKKDISQYEKAAKMKEQAVAGYANETLPVLKKHLETAESLNKGGKGRMSAR
jgi:putative membrane protein